MARIANSITHDYERLAGDIAEQQKKYDCIYSHEEIEHYLDQMDMAIQSLHVARFRLSHMLRTGSDTDFIYDICPEVVVKMRARILEEEDEQENEEETNDD